MTDFTLALDLRDMISAYGDGIHTIGVWGTIDGQATLLRLYSVVGGDRPDLRWQLARLQRGRTAAHDCIGRRLKSRGTT